MVRSPVSIFFLAFIPGMGHFAINRIGRAVTFMLLFFGILGGGGLLAVASGDGGNILIVIFFAAIVWLFNMLDIIIYLVRHPAGVWRDGYYGGNGPSVNSPIPPISPNGYSHNEVSPSHHNGSSAQHGYGQGAVPPGQGNQATERFFTILLSFIPGLGHLQLGLKQRGLTLLVGFFGMMIMIFFLSILTNQRGFLVFLAALPILWLYGMFDAISLVGRKQRGEVLQDITILEEWDRERETGRRSRLVATLFSVFPGAGHMYLGLQRRGLQLMAGFLFSIYILDTLRLTLFLFIVPIIWCYAFFDGLQQSSKFEQYGGHLQDEPVIQWLPNRQRGLGAGLILLGIYYVFDQLLVGILPRYFKDLFNLYAIREHIQSAMVAILLIAGGIMLLVKGTRKKKEGNM